MNLLWTSGRLFLYHATNFSHNVWLSTFMQYMWASSFCDTLSNKKGKDSLKCVKEWHLIGLDTVKWLSGLYMTQP